MSTTSIPQPGELTANAMAPHLADLVAQVEGCASLSEEDRVRRIKAAQKAAQKLLLGLRFEVVGLDAGDQLVVRFQSESTPEITHTTTVAGCDCRAGVEGKLCHHRPGRVLLWLLAGKPSRRAAEERLRDALEDPDGTPAERAAAVVDYGHALYVCPVDHGTMIETKTPGGEPCVECQNPGCHKVFMEGTYDVLERQGEAEARGVGTALGMRRAA